MCNYQKKKNNKNRREFGLIFRPYSFAVKTMGAKQSINLKNIEGKEIDKLKAMERLSAKLIQNGENKTRV